MEGFIEVRPGLFYEEATGDPWSNRKNGKRAETAGFHRLAGRNTAGYRLVRADGKMRKWNILVWELFHGAVPVGFEVDHRDNVGSHDRVDNLRLLERATNVRRRRIAKNNKSGFPGVRRCPPGQGTGWIAQITCRPRGFHLGVFPDVISGFRAYVAKKIELHGVVTLEPIMALVQQHCADLLPGNVDQGSTKL